MTEPTMRILSLGAGVQSTTLALMACDGTLPGLDAAIFADTGWEPKHVYEQVDRLAKELHNAGITFYRVNKGNLRDDATNTATSAHAKFVHIPIYVLRADGSKTIGRRHCTAEYKLEPINRKVRELLGAKPPAHRTVPRGHIAELWIGFSTDEITRVSDHNQRLYMRQRYPLIEAGMSRKDCQRWLDKQGWGHTAKSACIGCPYHGNALWRDLRDNRPAEWADAVAFDNAIRSGGAKPLKNGAQAFIHRSFQPLETAPIDRLSHRDYRELQGDLFDLLEDGDPDGCSPYGCRSGEPA